MTLRRLPLALTALLLGATTTACVDGDEAAACDAAAIPSGPSNRLVVEGDPWSGYAPFRSRTLLQDSAYEIAYVEQLCQAARADDLSDGDADFIVTTLDQYLINRPDGTIVGVIDQSRGADALVLNTVQHGYLTSIDALPRLVREYEEDGSKPVLAYTGGSPSEMLLNELANTTEELRLNDFELVSVAVSADANALLEQGEAQVAVLWEPDVADARADGYTVALSSEDAPDSIVDVLIASDALIADDPDAVQLVVDRFYERMDDYLADDAGRDELAEMIASDGALDPAAARSVLDGIKFYGAQEAAEFMNDDVYPLDMPKLEQSLRSIAALLALIHADIAPEDAKVDGSYVAQAASQ